MKILIACTNFWRVPTQSSYHVGKKSNQVLSKTKILHPLRNSVLIINNFVVSNLLVVCGIQSSCKAAWEKNSGQWQQTRELI